jgi:hypothetical protein
MTTTNRLSLIVAALALTLALGSCTTYYIPVESFKQQFAGLDSSSLREVTMRGPGGDQVTYKTYPIDFIKCEDDKGNPFELPNGPSIEIRFTNLNGKRTIFYFDLMRVNDSTITGIQSRFIPSIHKTISINQVRKIEVQDGHKNFHYVK